MHRIDTPTAQKDKFGQGKNGFTRGNPQTGTLATQLDYLYFDALQEEIANVIESVGITLNKEKHDQLKLAILQYVETGKIKLSSSVNSESETTAATSLAVKKAYDLASLINNTFKPLDFESVIFSPDKMFHLVVRNDGVLGFYNSKKNKLVWSVSPDGGLNNGYVNVDRIPGLNDFINQTNNNITNTNNNLINTNNRINETNDSLNKITDKFQPLDFESVIFSPSKQYHATVRDDGIFGFYDHQSPNSDLSWCVGRDGGLIHGYVNVDKIRGLEDFVNSFIPVGVPLPWPTLTPPPNFLICNGWQFDKSLYPRLAAAYPSGYLPEMRASTIRGLDAGRGIDVDRVILSEQGDAMRNLTGTFGFESNIGGNTGGANISGVFYSVQDSRKHATGGTAEGNSLIALDASRQVPVAHEFRVRSTAYLYIVRAA
ncbi:tail fiber protein [Gilliamella sp. Pas-s25]|uniref:tail fiber protein n=1 Tax=Gilliamella sp. Pas-s25 TaxID=2687310 RepID=UPI00135E3D49|nr:tail fiber protein [Gilliamella sp. Pas-s25]MWP61036.1 hypothetical protein [Gilliamella sp. Pas-s25]